MGSTLPYDRTALEEGTAVKLERPLWIIPVTLYISIFVDGRDENAGDTERRKLKIPYLIPGFLAAAALVHFIPELAETGRGIKELSQHLMILTLFLIGANLSREKLRELGLKPVVLGTTLWLSLSLLWCILITTGIVNCQL